MIRDLGDAHQLNLETAGIRKASGAYYTPLDVVDGLLTIALDPILAELEARGSEAVKGLRLLDPTCGSGNFLVPAFERIRLALLRTGVARVEAATDALRCVVGVDRDGDAVEICRSALTRAAGKGADPRLAELQVFCADTLTMERQVPMRMLPDDDRFGIDWASIMEAVGATDGFDVVAGNPPFLGQLRSETAFADGYLAELKKRFGPAAQGYVDPAALFLLVGLEVAKPIGGRVCLIEPISVLSARGAGNVRSIVLERSAMTTAWFANEKIFTDADVDVWAPVLEAGAAVCDVRLISGRSFRPLDKVARVDSDSRTWSELLARFRGVPHRNWAIGGQLVDLVSATADFRDQYYGLADHVVDQAEAAEGFPRLVTSGLIDPGQLLWGERDTTFNGKRYRSPRVDVGRLDPKMREWAHRRLRPKVLLATQTKVLEPVVDLDGSLLPSVPVISIEAPTEILWHIGALLISPPATAIAAERHLGAALSSDALKLSARDVVAIPTPANRGPWDVAAAAFRQASSAHGDAERSHQLVRCAQAMCAAYGVADDHELMRWWLGRLPRQRPIRVLKVAD